MMGGTFFPFRKKCVGDHLLLRHALQSDLRIRRGLRPYLVD